MAMFNLNDYILKVHGNKLLTSVFEDGTDAVDCLTEELKIAVSQSIKLQVAGPSGDIKPYHHAEVWIIPDLTALQDALTKMIHQSYQEGVERGLSGD